LTGTIVSRTRAALVLGAAVTALAATASSAGAHAIIAPAVAKTSALQQFTLSVPTEKANVTTTKVELDVPAGFAIDSYEPSPGWKRVVTSKGSGDSATVQKVVWTGGRTPTEEDSVFRFDASVSKSQTYRFRVQQTYSDGSVADWNGPESSDTPAPTFESVSSFAGGGSSTLAVIALIVAGVALLLAIVGLAGGRRPLT
jgi:uncharacterized protein YcnI